MLCCFACFATGIKAQTLSTDGSISVLAYNAKPDSVTDNTTTFQKALDEASKTGNIVTVPAGKFLIKGNLKLNNVSLVGVNQSTRLNNSLKGTVILATGGKNNEMAPALFQLNNSAVVKGITVYYPEQNIDSICPFPFTFWFGVDSIQGRSFDCSIQDITLVNSYNGVKTGPCENGRHFISNLSGCVLRRGIVVESVADIGRIENVHFHCVFWREKETRGNFGKAFKYMQDNLEAFTFGRSDWEYVTNTFVFPAKTGYRFIRTELNKKWDGGCNGQFNGIGADATANCILVDEIQPMGLLITNGQFNSQHVGVATQIITSLTCKGNIRFENCGFWGPVNHNAMLKGNAYVSFNNCYFSNNYITDQYSIVAENGKLQVSNCTFDATESHEIDGKGGKPGEFAWQPCIHLKSGLKQAIIKDNNGYKGVSIKNEIGGKAIIGDNEPTQNAETISPAYYKVGK
jgi:hypothetical protein